MGKRTRDMAEKVGTRQRAQIERQRLACGGCGRRPGGRRSMSGKELGSGCDREVRQKIPLLRGGGSRGGNKTIQKAAKIDG